MSIPIPETGESAYHPDFLDSGPLSEILLPLVHVELSLLESQLRDDTNDPTYLSIVRPRSDAHQALEQLNDIKNRFPALKLCVGLVLNSVVYPPAKMYEVSLLGYRSSDVLTPHIDRRKEVVAIFSLLGVGAYTTYERGPFSEQQPRLPFGDERLTKKHERLLLPGSLLVTNGDCEPEAREPHSIITRSDPRFSLVVRQVVEHKVPVPGSPEYQAAIRDGAQIGFVD